MTDAQTPSHRFAQIVSLDSNCYAAAVLERLGLKQTPLPFDWLFTTLPMVQSCIESDFAQILNRQYYKPVVWQGKTQYKHTFYDTHWSANFTHYDPGAGMRRVYLERCIDRWRDLMASLEPKLFFFVSSVHPYERIRYASLFENLTRAITSRTGQATVVGMTFTSTGEKPGFTEAVQIGDSRLFHYTSAKSLQGIRAEDSDDDARVNGFVLELLSLEQRRDNLWDLSQDPFNPLRG
jgi:Putative papain-like cysteine peptidase (DUF1796)